MSKAIKRCILAALLPCMMNVILLSDAVNQEMSKAQVSLVPRMAALFTLAVCFGLIYLGFLSEACRWQKADNPP